MGAGEHDGSGILRLGRLAGGRGRFDGLIELTLVVEGQGPGQVGAAATLALPSSASEEPQVRR